jgi:hypothetical protein
MKVAIKVAALLALVLVFAACNSTTVFHANFDADTIGSPPGHVQDVGTVSLDEGAGTVRVVAPPTVGTSSNWVRIAHPTTPTPQTAMRGDFAHFDGTGNYLMLCSLYIPSGTQLVTVQFEPFGQPATSYVNFFHIDFMTEDDVRIDDNNAVRFGHFPRNQIFVLSVQLNITNSGSTAHVALLGSGASGSIDVPINPAFQNIATQFGAIRFWMGFQWTGWFLADDITVTRRNM